MSQITHTPTAPIQPVQRPAASEAAILRARSDVRDEDVIAEVRAGHTDQFEVLMRRYNQRLFRAARAVLRDDAEAEDVMQEAWYRAFAHLDQFAGKARFSTWLLRIAVHEALARVRRRARHADVDPLDDESPAGNSDAETPELAAHRAELSRAIESAVDELPSAFRVVFVLRAIEGLSVSETAEATGLREETVKTRLFRAKGQLQRLLAQHEDSLDEAFAFAGHRCDRAVAVVFARIHATAK
jgi:RNA polymerase sigma-70 factor (ECF subfamily)